MGIAEVFTVLIGGGWTTLCVLVIMHYHHKRKLPPRPKNAGETGRGRQLPSGRWKVRFSMPGFTDQAFVVTPLEAEAVKAYLEFQCRCSNCQWKDGIDPADIADLRGLEDDAIIHEEIKALEP